MHDTRFDALTRRASLGGIAAAALLTAIPGAAGAKKGCKPCKKQVGACRQVLDPVCAGGMGSPLCFAAVEKCCGFLKDCKAGKAMQCLVDSFVEM